MTNPLFAPGFKTRPWWWEAAEPSARDNALPDKAEIAIVGGGYAGLSASLTLARLGHKPVVIDAERIGWGASSRNGGMVSGRLKPSEAELLERYGPELGAAIPRAAAGALPLSRKPLPARISTVITAAAAATSPPGPRGIMRRWRRKPSSLKK